MPDRPERRDPDLGTTSYSYRITRQGTAMTLGDPLALRRSLALAPYPLLVSGTAAQVNFHSLSARLSPNRSAQPPSVASSAPLSSVR